MSKSSLKSKRHPVMVDAAEYEFLSEYSRKTGIPVARLVQRALAEHIESHLLDRKKRLDSYVAGERQVTIAELVPSQPFTTEDALSDKLVLDGVVGI